MATVDQEMRNLEAVRRWTEEGENRRNAAVADELTAPDFEPHALPHYPFVPSPMQGGSCTERVKQPIHKDLAGLDARHTTLDQTLAVGAIVALRASPPGSGWRR